MGASYVLVGSLRRAGARLRINAQLVDSATDFPLWSERYDREMEDVFEVQDEIAQKIAAALRITLSPQEQQALSAKPTENLLWEIQSLTDRPGSRCVFVGQSNRVAGLTGSPTNAQPPGSLAERLLNLLEGREVLAYVTGRRGLRRFARALRARLLEFENVTASPR